MNHTPRLKKCLYFTIGRGEYAITSGDQLFFYTSLKASPVCLLWFPEVTLLLVCTIQWWPGPTQIDRGHLMSEEDPWRVPGDLASWPLKRKLLCIKAACSCGHWWGSWALDPPHKCDMWEQVLLTLRPDRPSSEVNGDVLPITWRGEFHRNVPLPASAQGKPSVSGVLGLERGGVQGWGINCWVFPLEQDCSLTTRAKEGGSSTQQTGLSSGPHAGSVYSLFLRNMMV